ncbi:hypothetical protein AVEN_2958-1 [Araneus ventricosus]|uniref:Uncharacterized protein n=1 Tax=Araneus ventricosus TaxID=182803 RepID=A0A4Y2PPS0_ARAVE|nr:hypothetical protein AVEN_2958-1 [Araneus ventricosus]
MAQTINDTAWGIQGSSKRGWCKEGDLLSVPVVIVRTSKRFQCWGRAPVKSASWRMAPLIGRRAEKADGKRQPVQNSPRRSPIGAPKYHTFEQTGHASKCGGETELR